MNGMFRRAERKQVKLKVGISAPSGAGKTYSALLMAYGICKDWSKIAVIDTENGSAELYSNLGEYSVCPIVPPYTPKKYMEAIKAADAEGFEVLIIDSLSHAWSGEGGLLDMQDKVTKASKSGNSYTAWREITPEHNRLIDAILQSDMDVIVTTRAKAEYVINDTGNGKKEIKKIGLAPVFRDGLEYELTVFFDMSQEHVATTSKDRTGIFDGKPFVPTVETGKALNEWRKGGAIPAQVPKEPSKAPEQEGSDLPTTLEGWQKIKITRQALEYFRVSDVEKTIMYINNHHGPLSSLTRQQTAEIWKWLWETEGNPSEV